MFGNCWFLQSKVLVGVFSVLARTSRPPRVVLATIPGPSTAASDTNCPVAVRIEQIILELFSETSETIVYWYLVFGDWHNFHLCSSFGKYFLIYPNKSGVAPVSCTIPHFEVKWRNCAGTGSFRQYCFLLTEHGGLHTAHCTHSTLHVVLRMEQPSLNFQSTLFPNCCSTSVSGPVLNTGFSQYCHNSTCLFT